LTFLNTHKGSSLISSHDIDFLEKTCHGFFFLDGSGIIKFSNKLEIRNVKVVNEIIKKDKKEKPISSEKLINKILKKIQNKEDEIADLTSKLEKTNFSSKQESNYNYLVNELNKAQFELNSLEKEWIDIEERMISDD
jgi:ATPase components of ABC transporters with duplicated ATPase domains